MKNKRILSWALAACLVLASAVPALAADIEFADMPNDWSTAALKNAVDNGLLSGSVKDGKNLIRAGSHLTRAEMAAIINKAFNASAKSDVTGVTDVKAGDWFYDHMAMAVKMNSFASAEKLRPNDKITREEAFTVLAKVFKLPNGNTSALSAFSDANNISEWAKARVAALIEAGYISGSGGKVNPKSNITRAEFAAVMNNIVAQYITAPGEVSEVAKGNVLVNVAGVTLKGVTVDGDLVIADGVGTGEVVLDSVKVTGMLVVRGGGANSIKIEGDSEISSVVVDNVNNEVRIYTADGVRVEKMDASGEVILEGTFGDVTVVGEGGSVAVNGTVGTLSLEASADIVVGKDATVGTVTVAQNAASSAIEVVGKVETLTTSAPETVVDVKGEVKTISAEGTASAPLITVQAGATVSKVESNAANTVVQGTGKVAEAVISGNNSQVNTNETKITVAAGTEGVKSGDKQVAGGATVTSDKDASSKAPMVEAPVKETPTTETPPETPTPSPSPSPSPKPTPKTTPSLTITMITGGGIASVTTGGFEIPEGSFTSAAIEMSVVASDFANNVTLTVTSAGGTEFTLSGIPAVEINKTFTLDEISRILSAFNSVEGYDNQNVIDKLNALTEGEYTVRITSSSTGSTNAVDKTIRLVITD